MLIVLIAMSLGLMSQNYVDVAMVEDMKREADEKSVTLYAKLSYTRPENMSNVDVAFYDIRTNIDVNVVPFMKRYYNERRPLEVRSGQRRMPRLWKS